MRQINGIHLAVTTACDRNCPDCCFGSGQRPAVHYPWPAYFQKVAEHVYGIERIRLTGGEPTLHPDFAQIAASCKTLFGCKTLEIETNGFRAREHAGVMGCFDLILVSLYGAEGIKGTGPGDNSEVVDWITAHFNSSVFDARFGFTPRSQRRSGLKCYRGDLDIAAYDDGKLYGCCVGPGIPGAPSIPLTVDWRERLDSLPLPCQDCWYSL